MLSLFSFIFNYYYQRERKLHAHEATIFLNILLLRSKGLSSLRRSVLFEESRNRNGTIATD